MTAEKLSDALSFLDDDIIEETQALREKKRNYKSIWIKTLSAAACLCIALVAVIGVVNSDTVLFKGFGGSAPTPPSSANENLYGGGNYCFGCGGTINWSEKTVLVRIDKWNDKGFIGTLSGENGQQAFYYTNHTAVVEFTDDTRTESYAKRGTTTISLAPTEEDFPVGTIVEVSYYESAVKSTAETVYKAERVWLFE